MTISTTILRTKAEYLADYLHDLFSYSLATIPLDKRDIHERSMRAYRSFAWVLEREPHSMVRENLLWSDFCFAWGEIGWEARRAHRGY